MPAALCAAGVRVGSDLTHDYSQTGAARFLDHRGSAARSGREIGNQRVGIESHLMVSDRACDLPELFPIRREDSETIAHFAGISFAEGISATTTAGDDLDCLLSRFAREEVIEVFFYPVVVVEIPGTCHDDFKHIVHPILFAQRIPRKAGASADLSASPAEAAPGVKGGFSRSS